MEYFNTGQNNIVCFKKGELNEFFRQLLLDDIKKDAMDKNVSIPVLADDIDYVDRKTTKVSNKINEGKEDHEIFLAEYEMLQYFGEDASVCFELNSKFRVGMSHIEDIEDLKKYMEEKTITDCLIKTNEGIRKFQLKRFRSEHTTEELFSFIKKVIEKYGNDMGDVNLFIILQPVAWSETYIDWVDLVELINELNYNFTGQILTVHNERNEFHVMNQLYPEPGMMKLPYKLPSEL